MNLSKYIIVFAVFVMMITAPYGMIHAEQMNVLLTNDDGYQAPGINYLYAALKAAGHNVTIVAPLENQSGVGATIHEGQWVEVLEQAPGVWSVDNTPTAAVRVGLDLIMKQNPPDLIISGMNFGQNLGIVASTNSGTVSAAHYGLIKNIPAIAVSIGILLDERNATPIPFPSTFKALAPAANFIVRLVEQLQEKSDDGRLLPPGTMLNVNFPVPYDDIKGVKFTRLGQLTFVDISYMDVYGVVANGGGMVLYMPVFPQGPDPVANADTNAFDEGYISITVMDGDMSTLHPPAIGNKLKADLFKLSVH